MGKTQKALPITICQSIPIVTILLNIPWQGQQSLEVWPALSFRDRGRTGACEAISLGNNCSLPEHVNDVDYQREGA